MSESKTPLELTDEERDLLAEAREIVATGDRLPATRFTLNMKYLIAALIGAAVALGLVALNVHAVYAWYWNTFVL